MPEVTIKFADIANGQVHIECVCKPDLKENEDPSPAQRIAIAVMEFVTETLGTPKKLEPIT